MPEPAETRAEQAYNQVRSDILAGRWYPGQRLPFDELCSLYGASVGVMREALQRLAEQGLVLAEPNRGFRIVLASECDLRHLTQARMEIETLVLRLAIEQGDLDWESRVLAARHRLERTPRTDPEARHGFNQEWITAHRKFHDELLSGCENTRLVGIATALRNSYEIYRHWSLSVGADRHRDEAGEHRDLLDFALARDPDGAAALLRSHIETTTKLLLEGQQNVEDPPQEQKKRPRKKRS